MSYSKYRAANGDCVFVENQRGLLFLSDGTQFTKSYDIDAGALEEYLDRKKSRKKRSKIAAMRILLGHGCNYACGYCMQKDIGNPFERPRNKNTEKFIADVKQYLDISEIQRIELWGGESLLYWKDIVEIITAFDKEGLEFYISTNGSPLQMKHIEFFKNIKGRVAITISHDGPGQETARGPDPILKRADVIRELTNYKGKIGFSFNTVVTRFNYDLFAINDYFKNVRDTLNIPVQLVFGMAQIYDSDDGNNDFAIVGEDLIKFQKILRDYLEASRKQLMEQGPTKNGDILWNNAFNFSKGSVKLVEEFDQEAMRQYHTNCGTSSEDIISLDINGDVRLCPHSGEEYKYGQLEQLDKVEIKHIDLDRNESHCKDCAIFRLCHSTCPITIPYPVFIKNCDAEKVWYTEQQRMALSVLLNQEVELEDWGLQSLDVRPLLS